MADVLATANTTIPWEEALWRGAPLHCETAFGNLINNLNLNPVLDPPDAMHDFFVQGTEGLDKNTVWMYRLPARHLSENWIPFMDTGTPASTFRSMGRSLLPNASRGPNYSTFSFTQDFGEAPKILVREFESGKMARCQSPSQAVRVE